MRTIIYYEWKKIFLKPLSKASFLIVILLSCLFAVSTYQNKYACDGKGREGTGKRAVEIDKDIARKYEGELTDAKVQEMLSDLMPKTEELHGMNAKYIYLNAMQSAAAAHFADRDGNWNGLSVRDVFGEEKIMIGYIDGWLAVSQDLVKIIIALTMAVIVLVAPVFSGEYRGTDQIILTSKYGKDRCTLAKVVTALIWAFILTTITIALYLTLAFWLYGKEGLSCSILFGGMSYAERFIPFNITCGTLLLYQVFLAYTGVTGAVGFTLFFSALCRSRMGALAASAAFYVLPVFLSVAETSPLFKLAVLFPVYHAQFVSLMSVGKMQGGLLHAVWAFPAAALLFLTGSAGGRRIFAGHFRS